MRLRDFIGKDIAGLDRPLRVKFDKGFNELVLPAVAAQSFRTAVLALFFPESIDDASFERCCQTPKTQIAVMLTHGKQAIRIRRGPSPDSVELQTPNEERKFQTRARGALQVERTLRKNLPLNSVPEFLSLYFGELVTSFEGGDSDPFDESWLGKGKGARPIEDDLLADLGFGREVQRRDATPEQIADLESEYRRTLAAEDLDDQIAALRIEIDQVNRQLDQDAGASLGLVNMTDQLTLMTGDSEVEVTDEEWRVLETPEQRIAEFERRQDTLKQRILAVDKRGRKTSLLRNPGFMAGTLLAIVATIASIVGGKTMRPIALANVLFLAGTAVGVLQFLQLRDEAGHRSSRRRGLEHSLEQSVSDLEGFREQLSAARRKHRAKDAEELRARHGEEEARRKEIEADTAAVNTSSELGPGDLERLQRQRDDFEVSLGALESERTRLGDAPVPAYQLERDLQAVGVDPTKLSHRSLSGPHPSLGGANAASCHVIVDVLRIYHLFEHDRLAAEVRELWQKLLGHLLGKRLELDLDPTGQIQVDGQPIGGLKQPTQSLIIQSLHTAALLKALRKRKDTGQAGPMPLMIRIAPFQGLSTKQSEVLKRLLERFSRSVQVIAVYEQTSLPAEIG